MSRQDIVLQLLRVTTRTTPSCPCPRLQFPPPHGLQRIVVSNPVMQCASSTITACSSPTAISDWVAPPSPYHHDVIRMTSPLSPINVRRAIIKPRCHDNHNRYMLTRVVIMMSSHVHSPSWSPSQSATHARDSCMRSGRPFFKQCPSATTIHFLVSSIWWCPKKWAAALRLLKSLQQSLHRKCASSQVTPTAIASSSNARDRDKHARIVIRKPHVKNDCDMKQ